MGRTVPRAKPDSVADWGSRSRIRDGRMVFDGAYSQTIYKTTCVNWSDPGPAKASRPTPWVKVAAFIGAKLELPTGSLKRPPSR